MNSKTSLKEWLIYQIDNNNSTLNQVKCACTQYGIYLVFTPPSIEKLLSKIFLRGSIIEELEEDLKSTLIDIIVKAIISKKTMSMNDIVIFIEESVIDNNETPHIFEYSKYNQILFGPEDMVPYDFDN